MDAIVYTSNTGFTAEYAKLLAKRVALPLFSLDEAYKKLRPGAEVIYLGWLLGGMVRGYKKAAKRFQVRAVCGVGMGATGSQIEEIRKANALNAAMPVFSMQGGMNREKLRGIYKFMMNMAVKAKAKSAGDRAKTPEEEDMLDLVANGGNRVSEKNLESVLKWYQEQK